MLDRKPLEEPWKDVEEMKDWFSEMVKSIREGSEEDAQFQARMIYCRGLAQGKQHENRRIYGQR